MNMVSLIEAKRSGNPHKMEEIDWIISNFAADKIPDYQMSAWLMAVCINGLSKDETFWMTKAMVETGKMMTFVDSMRPIIDKHSSGGVGDKVSLIVVPIISACGGHVFKMSGRGLSHTGGTIDKLESIPGFRTELSESQAKTVMARTGAVILSQSAHLVPADKKIYQLRDVTGTVPSIPLIAASIVSKKIAVGADIIVFDIKVGSGSFLNTLEEGKELAALMKNIVKRFGRRARFVLSRMNEPLGFNIGNRLEVAEAIEVLQGHVVPGLNELCIEIAAQALCCFKSMSPISKAKSAVVDSLGSGSALKAFLSMVKAQGGKVKSLEALTMQPQTRFKQNIKAGRSGYISHIDALAIGEAIRDLGAGRIDKSTPIDHESGIALEVKVGDKIKEGQVLLTLYGNYKSQVAAAAKRAASGIEFRATRPPIEPIVIEIL